MTRIRHQHFISVAPLPGEPDLFLEAARASVSVPPSVGVNTSREAAARIKPHVARVREAIFLWLKTQGSHGATAGEICTALGLSGSTVRPRLVELRGDAKWAPGLPKRIIRTWGKRLGMRVYVAI